MHEIILFKHYPFELVGGGVYMDKNDPYIGFKIVILFFGYKNILMFDDESELLTYCKNKRLGDIYIQHEYFRCPYLGYNPFRALH